MLLIVDLDLECKLLHLILLNYWHIREQPYRIGWYEIRRRIFTSINYPRIYLLIHADM